MLILFHMKLKENKRKNPNLLKFICAHTNYTNVMIFLEIRPKISATVNI